MGTAIISHDACFNHDTGANEPECSRRLSAISDRLVSSGLADLLRHFDAPEASDEQLLRVHTPAHVEHIAKVAPATGFVHLDPDTVMSPGSLEAARRAAGAVVKAVDLVVNKEFESVFCCVRPPGHHAESDRAMGFCLFNNIAVGAAHALHEHGVVRVAIVDFDVHQGNGTERSFGDDDRVLFCSTFQHPFYPHSPVFDNTPTRVNVPLGAGAGSTEFRAAIEDHWLPALRRFGPEIIFISAGFDAHRDDDMSHMRLTDDDYRWVTQQLVQVASETADGRIVSALEGGYEFGSLARSVELHLRSLMGLD